MPGEEREAGFGHGGCGGKAGGRTPKGPLTSHTLEAIQDTVAELFARVRGAGARGQDGVGQGTCSTHALREPCTHFVLTC